MNYAFISIFHISNNQNFTIKFKILLKNIQVSYKYVKFIITFAPALNGKFLTVLMEKIIKKVL